MKKLVLMVLLVTGFSATKVSAQTTPSSNTKTQFSIADSASFTGKYKFEDLPFEYFTISVREGQFHFEGGEYNGLLDPVSGKKDVFDVGGEAVFTFTRNGNDKISGLKVEYQGRTYEGKKEEKK